MPADVHMKMEQNDQKEQSIWGDRYMKITYAMLGVAVLPAVLGVLTVIF